MKITSAFLSVLFLLCSSAWATPVITLVSGVSNFETVADGTTQAAYGGIAGACAATNNTSTCSSCISTTSPPTACNPQSVYPSLIISVNFTVPGAITNYRVDLYTETGATGSTATESLNSTTMTIPAGGGGSITTTWGALCAKDPNFDGSCIPSVAAAALNLVPFANGSRSLTVWVDENGNGAQEAGEMIKVPIRFQYVKTPLAANDTQTYEVPKCNGSQKAMCGFTLTPGDSKFYLNTYAMATTADKPTNDPGSPDWLGIAFFSKSGAAVIPASVSNSSSAPVIKKYDSTYGITDSSIDGFENYQHACLVMGNINKAYNIYYFASTSADATKTCGNPSEVVGVLADKHCFISTAAFGSDMAPEVETFRQFRNHFLLNNKAGKQFVKMYYKYSPPLANVIAGNETLRAVARGFLYPFLIFSEIALAYGFLSALLSLIVALILIQAITKKGFRNKKVLVSLVLLFVFHANADFTTPTRTIEHPGAAEGLIKIKKDGTYIYKVKKEAKKESSHIYFGQANNPEVSIDIEALDNNGNATGGVNTYNFDDFYAGASKLIIGYDYEWYPWPQKTMLGLQGGLGFMYAEGHGRLVAGSGGQPNPASEEKFSFFTVPLSLGAIYRFQYKDTQILVPYVAGGGTYVVLAEKREDQSKTDFTGGFGFYGSGGLLLNISALDSETGFELDSEYGIGNLWLSLELRATEVEAEAFRFSTQYVNLGFAFDF